MASTKEVKDKNTENKRGLFRRFIGYYKPYKFIFVTDMIASLIYALLGLLYPILSRKILDTFIPDNNTKYIVIACVILLGIYIIRAGVKYYVNYYGHVMGVRMQGDMRRELFAHLEKLPYSFYDNSETGQLMTRMTTDLFDVVELAHHGPENLFITTFMTFGAFAYLCTINWKLALILLALLPVLVVAATYLRKDMSKAFADSRKEIGKVNATLENSISGIRVSKAYAAHEYEECKFEKDNKSYMKARFRAFKSMGRFFAGMNFFTEIYNVVVLVAGALFCVLDENFDYVDLVTFMLAINLFTAPIQTLINFFESLEDGITGFRRYCAVLDEKIEKSPEKPIFLTNPKGKLTFENVSFRYNVSIANDYNHLVTEEEKTTKKKKRKGREKVEEERTELPIVPPLPVLKNINIDIPAGKTYALVGASGGGKTTLCHLVPKFYLPTDGKILIDDKNITDIDNDSLRRAVGIVQQDVFLFSGSFKDNIAYGNPNASFEEIVEAAKKANIHDYILSLPNGYDTDVGERGIKLSGGQKQRISIARVFLKNPAILILDEATSALDNATEALIQKALFELCKGRTTLVVAHRLSTIRSADEIIVIEEGEIKERGTHKELLEKGGAYKTLYEAQYSEL